MKKTKISLAALLALTSLTCANAKTSLEEAIKGTTISGYAYGQITSMFGADASGSAFRSRVWADINTGAVGGFSVGTRVYASIGGGAPNGGTFLGNSKAPNDIAPFGMYALYGNMDFTEYGSKTTLMAGKLNIMTPFNDTDWDYGYGVYASNEDLEGVKFSAQIFGAWALDDSNSNPDNPDLVTAEPLYIVGVEAGGEKLAGAAIKVYAGHSTKVIDYMVAGDVSYTISGLTIQSQVAVMDVDTSSKHFVASTPYNSGADLSVNLRGLYNIQLSYAEKDLGFSAKAGFTGSFGDGYGALLNYSAFNMGGQFWYDTVSGNGFGLMGVGGYKEALLTSGTSATIQKTNILVAYAGVQYTGVKSLKLGLDYAYVSGDNNYRLMVAGEANQARKTGTPVTNMNATFHEVSLTASYGFFDNKLTVSGILGSTFGDLEMARARMRVTYSF